MNLLLDTHILLWFFQNHASLSRETRELILHEKNTVYYSVVSAWEVFIKHAAHPDKMLLDGEKFLSLCVRSGFEILTLTEKHLLMLNTLRRPDTAPAHKDPFDRMLIAQAKAEEMTFITHDRLLPYYNETCIMMV